jgi:hypothetical protein
MKITLLERPTPITAKNFRNRLERTLNELKGDLTASLTLDGFSRNGWARINVTGEDNEIVAELIMTKFAIAHTETDELEIPGVYDAQLIESDQNGLKFDVGLDAANSTCLIPTHALQAQLADGKNMQTRRLIEIYCLYPGENISVRTTRKMNNEIEAWLSDGQIERLSGWITSGLDRIMAYDCYEEEAEAAVLKTHLTRDIIRVEPVTLTMQSILCKLGTDAVGLIPKLGHALRKQKLRPFLPKRIVGVCRPW